MVTILDTVRQRRLQDGLPKIGNNKRRLLAGDVVKVASEQLTGLQHLKAFDSRKAVLCFQAHHSGVWRNSRPERPDETKEAAPKSVEPSSPFTTARSKQRR